MGHITEISHDLYLVPYLAGELGPVGPIVLIVGVLNGNDGIRVDELLVESDELVSRQQLGYNLDRGVGKGVRGAGGNPTRSPRFRLSLRHLSTFPHSFFPFFQPPPLHFPLRTFSMPPPLPFLSSR